MRLSQGRAMDPFFRHLHPGTVQTTVFNVESTRTVF